MVEHRLIIMISIIDQEVKRIEKSNIVSCLHGSNET